MKTQFEVRIVDSLKVWVTVALVFLILKVGALDGGRWLADYSLKLAVGWGIVLVIRTLLAWLYYAGDLNSDPTRITVSSDGFVILNLRNNRVRKVDFKQIVAYRFYEGDFMDELRIVLEGRADHILFLSAYSFYREAKEYRSMLQALEEAVSQYNQCNDEGHVIRRDAPFGGKSIWTFA